MGDRLIVKQINNLYDTEKAIENVLSYIVRDKDMQENQEVRYWKAFGASRKNIKKKYASNLFKFRKWQKKTTEKESGIL